MSLLSSAIGAGASLIGNIFGSASNNKANKTNLRIAHMNNEFSERMMQKQMDYNTGVLNTQNRFAEKQAADANAFTEKMWNKTNEYNSAQAQAERLRAAGLNPALVMSGQNAGTAQGASGSQAATPSGNSVGLPSPSSVSVRPYQYDFSGVGSALMSAFQLNFQKSKSDAETRFIDMQSDYYAAKTMAEIGKMYAETKSHTAKTYYQNLMNLFGKDMMNQDYINKVRQNQSMEVQIMNTIRQGVLMDKQIARYDERMNAEIADLVASTALKYSQKQLNKEQLKNVIQDTIGKRLSNKEKDAIFDYVVDKARNDIFSNSNPWNTAVDFSHTLGNKIDNFFRRIWK